MPLFLCAANSTAADWPARTDELCHHCLQPISTSPPYGLPVAYDPRRRRYECLGFFCCLGCVEARRLALRVGEYRWVQLMAHEFYGVPDGTKIHASPPAEYLAVLYSKHKCNLAAAAAEFHSAEVVVRKYPAPNLFVRVTYFLEQETAAQAEENSRKRHAERMLVQPTPLLETARGCMEEQKKVLRRRPPQQKTATAAAVRSIFGGPIG